MNRTNKKRNTFTLIELLVNITIIAISANKPIKIKRLHTLIRYRLNDFSGRIMALIYIIIPYLSRKREKKNK